MYAVFNDVIQLEGLMMIL